MVTLNLLNYTGIRSVPSPTRPGACDDIGSGTARLMDAENPGGPSLVQTLYPFQLLYTDDIEHLGAESLREQVRWVGAFW